MSKIIQQLEQEQLRTDIPAFAQGDTVRVQVRVKEGGKERLQAFEGIVIAKRNRGLHSAFTVRKISNGEGVERVFQTHSPLSRTSRTYSARSDSCSSVRARLLISSGLLCQVRPSDCLSRQRRITS